MIKTNKYFKGSFMRQLGDDLQYFDLKQITDMEQEFKRHAQAALKAIGTGS